MKSIVLVPFFCVMVNLGFFAINLSAGRYGFAAFSMACAIICAVCGVLTHRSVREIMDRPS